MKKKGKKLIGIFIGLVLLASISVGCYYYFVIRSSNKYKLKEKGYSDEEIIEILKDEKFTNYVLENEYDTLYFKFINTKNYSFENLDKYLSYFENNQDASLEDVVYLVNNNIDKPYRKELMNILLHNYYISNNLDRYLNYLDKTGKDVDSIIVNVNSNIDYDFYTNTRNSDTSKGYLLIANKFYKLDSNYKSSDLVTMNSNYTRVGGAQLDRTTYEAFKKLSDDARSQGYYIFNTSAYRSYQSQDYIYNNYKAQYGLAWADSCSARPGFSEHQTGLALDVGTSSTTLSTFEYTKEFTWMKANAHKYGFILRYPKGKEYITGYTYEPWHYRYVGTEVATKIYETGLTFEEYYAYYIENAK